MKFIQFVCFFKQMFNRSMAKLKLHILITVESTVWLYVIWIEFYAFLKITLYWLQYYYILDISLRKLW